MRKIKEAKVLRYIYQNKLDKGYFQLNMAFEDFKDFTKRTAADRVLSGEEFNIAGNPEYDGYQHGLDSIVYKLFDKKNSDGVVTNEIMSNKELAEELHNLITRKFEKQNIHTSFIDNIWDADLADIQ